MRPIMQSLEDRTVVPNDGLQGCWDRRLELMLANANDINDLGG